MNAFDELAERCAWICWRLDPPRREGAKPVKTPVNPLTGANASTTEPTTWADIETALQWLEQHQELAGLGYVFSDADPFTGVDLDGCVDAETGEIAPWALRIVERLRSYTEWSPSRRGLHVIVRAYVPLGGNRRGSVEMYERERYFTVTGWQVAGTPDAIREAQPALSALHREIFETDNAGIQPRPKLSSGVIEPDDETLLRRMFASTKGMEIRRLWDGDMRRYADGEHPNGNPSSADLALAAHLHWWTGGDRARVDRLFRQSRLWRDKWDEKRGRTTYGERTLGRVGARGTTARGAMAS